MEECSFKPTLISESSPDKYNSGHKRNLRKFLID